MKCKLCNNDARLRVHTAREMMFGMGGKFDYLECLDCGCLQLESVPPDMGKYYPPDYYSREDEAKIPAFVRWLMAKRDKFAFTGKGLLGGKLNGLMGNPGLTSLARVPIGTSTRILDVGCGSGALLKSLRRLGLKHLAGIDPYNEADVVEAGLTIRKASLAELHEQWDIIMLHHTFEHLADPAESLVHIRRLLAPGGVCLLRIPLVPSEVWDRYGVDWVQLDAPRHYYIHSVASVRRLAEASGLALEQVVYDSTSFQFWGSELYKRDIPLQKARGKAFFKIFSFGQLRGYAKDAKRVNAEGRGDQAALYLKKPLP